MIVSRYAFESIVHSFAISKALWYPFKTATTSIEKFRSKLFIVDSKHLRT